MLYPKNLFRFIWPVHVDLKTDKLDYLRSPTTDDTCFWYIKFSWIGVPRIRAFQPQRTEKFTVEKSLLKISGMNILKMRKPGNGGWG